MQFFILILLLAILLALAGSIPKLLLILLLTFPAAIIGKLYDKWYEKNEKRLDRPKAQKFIEQALKEDLGTREHIESYITHLGLSSAKRFLYEEKKRSDEIKRLKKSTLKHIEQYEKEKRQKSAAKENPPRT